jgi:ATP-dependent DNA helicase Q4
MILPGLPVVVSPLLSLMVDQLRKLPAFLPGGLLASSQVDEMCAYSFW